jgi:stage III sporulation protein AB
MKTARGKSFGDIWLSALTEVEALNLRPPETEALGELAPVLGRYDPEQKEDAINKARKRLETFLAKAESECDREGKTRIALGIASGAAAAILLI